MRKAGSKQKMKKKTEGNLADLLPHPSKKSCDFSTAANINYGGREQFQHTTSILVY
jgi:hypothetical protein